MVNQEEFGYRLVSAEINSFTLHPKYGTDQELEASNGDFRFGINWKIVETNEKETLIDMTAEIRLLRKEDRFQIVYMELTGHYTVSPNLSFDTKTAAISEIFNNLSAVAQGAWHVRIANPNIASILPQAYNRMLNNLEELKKQVYETWE